MFKTHVSALVMDSIYFTKNIIPISCDFHYYDTNFEILEKDFLIKICLTYLVHKLFRNSLIGIIKDFDNLNNLILWKEALFLSFPKLGRGKGICFSECKGFINIKHFNFMNSLHSFNQMKANRHLFILRQYNYDTFYNYCRYTGINLYVYSQHTHMIVNK